MERTNILVCLYANILALAKLVPKSAGRKESSIRCKAINQNDVLHCVHWGKIYIIKYIDFVAANRKKNSWIKGDQIDVTCFFYFIIIIIIIIDDNNEIKKQVTSSWSLFIQLSRWCTVQ